MGFLAPKVPEATQAPLAITPAKSKVDPNTGAGRRRALERAAVAARAGGKGRFRVPSADLQTPGGGGLRIPSSTRS